MSKTEKVHTTNYYDTFIEVAEDCPAVQGEVPKSTGDTPTVAALQYAMLSKHPYKYTSDDVVFQVYADRNDLTKAEYKEARQAFFSKGQPCLRASPLTKRYGFGVHADHQGKVALYGVDTAQYKGFVKDATVKKLKAMRSARK